MVRLATMEVILSSSVPSISSIPRFSAKSSRTHFHFPISHTCNPSNISLSFSSSPKLGLGCRAIPTAISTPLASATGHQHWMVLMESPPQGLTSKPQIIDYYVRTLERVLGSEKDAQMCIYDASCDANFGFCCDIYEEAAHELAGLPGVLSVMPDRDYISKEKDYRLLSSLSSVYTGSSLLFPAGTSKHWLVRTSRPDVGFIRKAPVVDYYVQILAKVIGNEKDAQMCLYHVSWESNFGFCCELDNECAKELAGVPGVLSVQPDEKFGSDDKDYEVSKHANDSQDLLTPNIKTKKLFVTGLSFYTSEKTLRAAFEGYGELVEVKIIMDKISKRSKGYAFVEYTTEEAASAALNEMNGKIINGWMITVDVARKNPPKYNRGSSGSGR
ncbi:organelle RRM domain-containing protein 1, chloroplastic isoform X2 [Ipomoea triloba]|uniref:organelle RRM domain-containing protein 1, chloroplastic isoform X2 n=1 Tax=Ipomoea triloba TaxID=35885 RepID=UPI00125DA469|nr:organelle RRM domain-containing protein 1, chloroplastic isoform X2 [Ipomoea triloba]